jgi:hypothetical protein
MRNFNLVLGILLLGSTGAHASSWCKNKTLGTVVETIAALEPKIGFNVIDLELFPKGDFTSGYDFQVEPAYTKGLYGRTDRWDLGLDILPEKEINLNSTLKTKVTGGFKTQLSVTFTRYFKDPCEAYKPSNGPRTVPLKAKTALSPKFLIGDYFLLKGAAGVVVTGDILNMFSTSAWGISVGASYLTEGTYQLHIVRLNETRVRLKVVTRVGHTYSGNVGIGFQNEFDVFGLNVVNNALERFVNTKPIKIQADKVDSNVFMLDYILDLTDPEVVEVFEKMLPKIDRFKNIKSVEGFKEATKFDSNAILDITGIEKLYQQDYQDQKVDRVRRNLRTSSDQWDQWAGKLPSIFLGNKAIGYQFEKNTSTATMSISRPDNSLDYYLFKSWETNWEARFMFSWFKTIREDHLNALFQTDDKFNVLAPINLVQEMRHKKNRFGFDDFEALKLTLRKALPFEIYKKIPFESWAQKKDETYHNYGLRYELSMSPEIIMATPSLKKAEIKNLFRDYIASKGLAPGDYFMDANLEDPEEKSQFSYSLNIMAGLLEQALNQDLVTIKRMDFITEVRKNTLFKESGIGFLLTLNPGRLKEWCQLDLDISANEGLIEFDYGDSAASDIYKKMLTIKAALDDDSLDLLREAESLRMSKVR